MTGPQPGRSSACTVSCRSCSGGTRWSRLAGAAAPGDVQLPPRPGVPRLPCHPAHGVPDAHALPNRTSADPPETTARTDAPMRGHLTLDNHHLTTNSEDHPRRRVALTDARCTPSHRPMRRALDEC